MDRISTSLAQHLGIKSILFQQTQVNQTQQQISLGKRILTPSDDPADSVRILDLNQSLSRLDQFQDNLDFARSRLSLSEGTLQAVTASLQRTRELAVQGFNATNSTSDKVAIAEEIFQRLDEIVALANTKDAGGDYIYSGFKAQTEAITGGSNTGVFSFQGDQGQRLLKIGENREISDSNSGAEMFFNLKDKNGNPENMFSTLYKLATDLANDRPASEQMAITTAAQPADTETVTINGVTYEFDSGGGVTPGNIAVTIGIDTDATSSNLEAQINLQQGAGNTNVTATVNGSVITLIADEQGEGTLSFSDGTSGDITITTSASIPLHDHLDQIDTALGRVLEVRSQIGARLNVIDSQSETNQDFELSIRSTKSQIEDLDMAEAISNFNLQIVALQAAQQAFVRTQNLSLFNML